jgi:2,3-bisphosphoglycerate-independent phosphoglycerate mutase
VGPIRDGAAVVLFNFRGDRAIEISRAFEDASLHRLRPRPRPDVFFAGMMQYDGDLGCRGASSSRPPDRAHPRRAPRERGSWQLACSETQKYGHVTYFWNGNRSEPFDDKLETYVEIPSDTLPFEERPWMKAAEITDRVFAELKHRQAPARARQLRERRHGRAHRGASTRPCSRSRPSIS